MVHIQMLWRTVQILGKHRFASEEGDRENKKGKSWEDVLGPIGMAAGHTTTAIEICNTMDGMESGETQKEMTHTGTLIFMRERKVLSRALAA